jgi:16S rRNA (uracil1498-N3)-methyltransferase
MKQFILPHRYHGEPLLALNRREAHYLLHVRRLREGDELPGGDARGNRYVLKILRILEEGGCELAVDPVKNAAPRSIPSETPLIILQPCLLKGKKMDTVLRQATEAGAAAIQPLISRNTVAKPREEGQKEDRWQKILKEAAQQSGNSGIPSLSPPRELSKLSPLQAGELGLYFHEKALDNKSLHGYLEKPYNTIYLLLGPEGGLSVDETAFLDGIGYQPVHLGSNVLRAETAAVFALGAVMTIVGEQKLWSMKK